MPYLIFNGRITSSLQVSLSIMTRSFFKRWDRLEIAALSTSSQLSPFHMTKPVIAGRHDEAIFIPLNYSNYLNNREREKLQNSK